MLDLKQIQTSIEKEEDYFIDEDTILSTYEGHTIFSIFLYKFDVFRKIMKQLSKVKMEDEKIFTNKSDNVFKRLYRIL